MLYFRGEKEKIETHSTEEYIAVRGRYDDSLIFITFDIYHRFMILIEQDNEFSTYERIPGIKTWEDILVSMDLPVKNWDSLEFLTNYDIIIE